MERFIFVVFCLSIVLSLAACENKDDVEVELKEEDIQELIAYNFNSHAVQDDNYVSSEVDDERNVVIVDLKDNSKEKQDEFINNVFTISTGSIYMKYLKEHSMIVFK